MFNIFVGTISVSFMAVIIISLILLWIVWRE